PSARRLCYRPPRFPIADAHYAMGYGFLYEAGGDTLHLTRAIHFLDTLEKTRCVDFKEYCWGYPFDWVTRNGVIKAGTPLITTTPYCYEAFLQVYEILKAEDGGQPPSLDYGEPGRTEDRFATANLRAPSSNLQASDLLAGYKQILASIARHAANDI